MLGGIYSDQRCPVCRARYKDNFKTGLVCPNHADQEASRFRVYFRGVTRRFSSYSEASRHLTGLRFKTDEGSFDKRDYRKSNPLGFENLALKYLEQKREEVRCYRNIQGHISRAMSWFGPMNIKEIGYGELEDFIRGQRKEGGTPLSQKSLHNILATLHAFFKWVSKREREVRIPDFPEIRYELGWRNTVSLNVQDQILDEIQRACLKGNRKIWFGVYLLSTYPKIRPVELLNLREGDIDLNLGFLNITHNKERKPKIVALTREDVELFKSFPRGLPHLYFFRHEKGVLAGKRFGKDLWYSHWKRACRNLGIENVDLYGGTKHSTVRGMREYFRPDEIRQGTGIVSNKAFERYFQHEFEDELKIYQKRQDLRKAGKKMAKDLPSASKGKLIDFQ
jgi:integrase